MPWVELVAVCAVIEYLVFGTLVARARGKYKVAAPAITGHPVFERFYRVQANTMELLVAFLPALWIAGKYWSPLLVGALGALFVVARAWYAAAYVREPRSREIPFTLSMVAILVLIALALAGVLHSLG
jgi:glutathione S-transferase